MKTGNRAVAIYFVICGLVIFVGVMFFAPLPTWLRGVLAIPLIFFAARAWRSSTAPLVPPEPAPEREPFVPESPAEPCDYRVEMMPLPSEDQDYLFEFSATVRWIPLSGGYGRSVSAQGQATKAVLEKAMAIARATSPERAALVRHELAAELGSMRLERPGFPHRLGRADRGHPATERPGALGEADQPAQGPGPVGAGTAAGAEFASLPGRRRAEGSGKRGGLVAVQEQRTGAQGRREHPHAHHVVGGGQQHALGQRA